MFKNTFYFLVLCLLAVKAQSNSDVKSPEDVAAKDSETVKVEPANISALYIGDLLRTKPKDTLEASGSAHRPVISNEAFLAPAPVAGRSLHYKAHGGHEYAEKEYIQPVPKSRAHAPDSIKRIGNTGRYTGPVNVRGHLLTLKPVRVVSADAVPVARDSRTPPTSHHHPDDDCSKSGENSYSSEENSYVPEQRTYRRAHQIAPSPVAEYRSHRSSYPEDERHYSHSEPSSASHDSRSHSTASGTKSHSSGSYTKSKSTSTSRTVSPNRSKKEHVLAPTVSSEEDYEKSSVPVHGKNGVIVYKVKEPSSSGRPTSHPHHREREYPTSNYEREQKSGNGEYEQYNSEVRKPVKHSNEGHRPYSTNEQHSPKERPQQYGPAPYEDDRGGYGQTPYTPKEEQRYPEQNKPSANYQEESEYSSQADSRDQEQQKPYHQNYEAPKSPVRYETEQPSKPHSDRKPRNQHYERAPHTGRESAAYRKREPTAPEYNYYHEQQIQSSRSRKERPQNSYEAYSSPDVNKETAPVVPQSYERNHPALRPSEEKQLNQYAYEPTPHQNIRNNHRSSKRQFRESPRSPRTPEKQGRYVIEERANLPRSENGQVIMVSRESQPYVSRSQSYPEGSYNMGENQAPKRRVKEQEQMQPSEERQADTMDYQTSYKPHNSEYPASYANDQYHNTRDQYQSQGNQQRYEEPESYEETPHQHQPHEEERPYEQAEYHDQDDSQEHGGQMEKKGKNHHYISKVEGYKDTYGHNEPLVLDEEFFRKYGISKKSKVIVASAQKPNLFVADGTNIKEGDYFADSAPINVGGYEPDYKNSFREDSTSESQEELGAPKEIPGSFDDLVDTNPRFLRKLPQIMKPSSGFFAADDSEASFDAVEFRDAADQKGFVVSQGPREIVQQHGDGVSRIIFNVPKDESKLESSNAPKVTDDERSEEGMEYLASKVIEKIMEPKS